MKNLPCRSLLSAVLCILCLTTAYSQNRRFTAGDIVSVCTLSDLRISPDGRWLAFVASSPDRARDRQSYNLWIVATDGREVRQLTKRSGADTHPRWSPGGEALAFLSDREAGSQVFLLDLVGGEPRRVSLIESSVKSFGWSPDGSHLTLLAPPAGKTGSEERRPAYLLGEEHLNNRVWLQSLNGEMHKAELLGTEESHVSALSWAHNGSKVAMVHSPSSEADASGDASIAILELDSRRQTALEGSSLGERVAYSPASEDLAYVRPFDGKGISRHDLFLIPSGTRNARNISGSLDRDVDDLHWAPDGNSVYFAARRGVRSVIYQGRSPAWVPEKIFESKGSVRSFQVDSRGKLYAIESSPSAADEVWALSELSGPRRLTRFNDRLQEIDLDRTEVILWKSKDGLEIEGLVVIPRDCRPGRPCPLIVDPHGGPRSHRDGSFDPQAQFFAARGYAVLKPNFRGSTGYGDAFTRGNVGDWGTLPFADIMTGVDRLVSDGVVDPDNLFLYGWSYGGYLANWAITHSNRFRAVASGAGVADGVMQYVISDARRWRFDYFRGSPFDGNLELYRQQSPITYIREAATPTLFIHGEKDVRCPIEQGIMMHRALRDCGVETEMAVYPGEGHGFVQLNSITDRAERVVAWFDKYRRK